MKASVFKNSKITLSLLILLVILNTGCPQAEKLAKALFRAHEGADLLVVVAQLFGITEMAPTSVWIVKGEAPNTLQAQARAAEPPIFNGFLPNSGQLYINLDFKGDTDWPFPITGTGNKGCVDFGFNGCDPTDVNIEYFPAEDRFQISSPFPEGNLLEGGLYSIEFAPGVFTFPEGLGNLMELEISQTASEKQATTVRIPFSSSFVRYLSTLANGPAGDLQVTSTVVVSNPSDLVANCQLDLFNSQTGKYFDLRVAGQVTNGIHQFQVPAGSSVRLEVDHANNSFNSAWGVFTSDNHFVAVSAVYSTYDSSGALRGEAGVSAVTPAFRHTLNIKKFNNLGVHTALAIANTTGIKANFHMTLLGVNDNIVKQSDETLGPRQQSSRFFTEFLGEVVRLNFSGTLIIESSNAALAVNTIQTTQGFQTSSLAGGVM